MAVDRLRRKLLLAGASAMALAAARPRIAPAAAATAPLTIANASGGLNLVMGELMRRQRFLEALGLAPTVLGVSDGTKILGGVVGGSVDATFMSGFGQVFPAIERGADIRIIGGGALLPVLALFSAKPAVRTLHDLGGRTIGTGSIGALVYQLTVTLLRKYAVDVAAVRFVNIGSNADIFRAVSAGTVDAGVGEAALIETAAQYGVHPIEHGNMSVELKDYTYQGAWASTGRIATKRDVLVRALAAYAQLYRFVQQPNSRVAFLQARRAVFPRAPDTDHEAAWSFIQMYKPFAVDLILGPERLRYMQELNVGFKVQRAVLPFERVTDMSLAVDAIKLLSGHPA